MHVAWLHVLVIILDTRTGSGNAIPNGLMQMSRQVLIIGPFCSKARPGGWIGCCCGYGSSVTWHRNRLGRRNAMSRFDDPMHRLARLSAGICSRPSALGLVVRGPFPWRALLVRSCLVVFFANAVKLKKKKNSSFSLPGIF